MNDTNDKYPIEKEVEKMVKTCNDYRETSNLDAAKNPMIPKPTKAPMIDKNQV